MTTTTHRSPRRRTVVALAIILTVFLSFVVRLVDIQVVNAREHVDDSLAMGLQSSRVEYASRGSIVDENGVTLASSVNRYDVQVDPMLAVKGVTIRDDDDDDNETTTPWPDIAAQIAAVTGQDAGEVQKIVTDAVADNPDSRYAMIARNVSTEQYRALVALGLPFLSFPRQAGRVYPDGAVGGNLIGFVGGDGQPLAGLEAADNDCLASTNGKVVFQQSRDGVVLPGTETVAQPAVDGGTLKLTIDRDLQWYLAQLIAEQVQNTGSLRGTITVVEAKTGKIRALAEYPAVDPNDPTATAPDDRGSRAFSSPFEPGSTFKALTTAIGLDSGSYTPQTTVTASGSETLGDARVSDAFSHGPNVYTPTGVLIDSSNVGISKFAEMIPKETRFDYLQKFGVGSISAIDFPGESAGILHPVKDWDTQTFYNTAFGQGLSVTVPQLVGAYQTIANGGLKMPLSLVESCTAADGTVTDVPSTQGTQVISADTAHEVSLMLENVATQGELASKIAIPGYRIAIKTGTGEKVDENTGVYKPDAYFTTMIGFAPADDPQYVVAVNLDEPRTVKSSAATAPAFQKALTQVLKTYRVIPSGTTTPELPKFG